jgi:hypothetical protein
VWALVLKEGLGWNYSTSLSDSGEIEAGDYVEVDGIPGFASTSADDATGVAGADGTTWNITYIAGSQEVEAVYTGNAGTVKNTTSGIANLITLTFLDTSSVDGGFAEWGSDDHAAVGSHIGQAESPVSGQIVDAPLTSVPVPASALGASALFGLLLLSKAKKIVLA